MKNIPITEREQKLANEEALYIYGYLRKKYCNDNVSDLDIVLNSLCFALSRLIKLHVNVGSEQDMINIINKILSEQFKKDEKSS